MHTQPLRQASQMSTKNGIIQGFALFDTGNSARGALTSIHNLMYAYHAQHTVAYGYNTPWSQRHSLHSHTHTPCCGLVLCVDVWSHRCMQYKQRHRCLSFHRFDEGCVLRCEMARKNMYLKEEPYPVKRSRFDAPAPGGGYGGTGYAHASYAQMQSVHRCNLYTIHTHRPPPAYGQCRWWWWWWWS